MSELIDKLCLVIPAIAPGDHRVDIVQEVISGIRELEAELAAIKSAARDESPLDLIAVAKKLPKTADGVRVGVHDWVYHPQSDMPIAVCFARDDEEYYAIVSLGSPRCEFCGHGHKLNRRVSIEECYSTREAAKAARNGGGA